MDIGMKYCPLCASEYREGVEECATCRAVLVASLSAEGVRANPPRLLWIGKDAVEFDLVAGVVRDAGIPELAEEGPTGILQKILKSESQICVLQSDLDRALEVAGQAMAGRRDAYGAIQKCYECGVECSASLAVCPSCKTTLIAERKLEREASAPEQAVNRLKAKYCPLCDAEFQENYDRCTVCGVELVPEVLRGKPFSDEAKNARLVVVWRGGDPVAISEVVSVLREAGIRHHVESTHDYLVFGLAMPRPKYVVRVLQSDAERARELLTFVTDSPFFGAESSAASPEETASAVQRVPVTWNSAAATIEIWVGEDAALAHVLEDCLRENRVGFRLEGREPGKLRLLVMREDEAKAMEILREVREGTSLA